MLYVFVAGDIESGSEICKRVIQFHLQLAIASVPNEVVSVFRVDLAKNGTLHISQFISKSATVFPSNF